MFLNGFQLIAYYIAMIYGMAKIIPTGHPYLNPDNIGKFGIFQAIAAAWRSLEFSWKNIDRVIFFFALIAGLTLMLAYVAGAVFFLTTAPSMAQSYPSIGTLFTNPNPNDDIAFMMMDKMLGIPGIFNSKIVTSSEYGPVPSPFHMGLQALFAYFSWAIFGIAVVMLLYFLVEIVLETTQTGTPFGKHFQNPFVPLRIVAGLGLLIPVSAGMNSAQWITLYTAKMGSNFATNAWIAFNTGMENPLGMTNKELVALPTTPDFTGLAKDLFTIRACKDIDQKLASGKRKKETSSNPDEIIVTGDAQNDQIDAFFVDGNRYFTILGRASQDGKFWPSGYASNFLNIYAEGLRFYKGKDIHVVFGRYNEEDRISGKFPGGVEPVCGDVLIPNLLPAGQELPAGNISNADVNQGLLIGASQLYAVLNMVIGISKTGFQGEGDQEDEYNEKLMKYATDRYYFLQTSQGQRKLDDWRGKVEDGLEDGNPDCPHDKDNDGIDNDGDDLVFTELGNCKSLPGDQFFANLASKYQRYFSYGPVMGFDYYTGDGQDALDKRCAAIDCGNIVSGAAQTCQRMQESCEKTRDGYADYLPLPSVYYEDLGQVNPFLINRTVGSGLFKYGWGGAGIWYKIIAERNGDLTGAAFSLPHAVHYPRLMEMVGAARAKTDKSVATGGCEAYNPAKAGSEPIALPGNVNDTHQMATLYYNLCNNLKLNPYMSLPGTTADKTGNPILDVINGLFDTKTLFSFRENSGVNPMAQMATLGRALIDKAISLITFGAAGSAVGGLLSLFGQTFGSEAGSLGPLALGGGKIVIALSQLAVSFAFVGLVAGVLLFYVIPFMPFMYFFFAVGTWVKTIFEALVGVPLWGLAHVRLDDESPGFTGKAASGGYYLLLEIFIRPIVTLFALVAAMFIFMALASVLNVTWGVVSSNLVGYDPVTQLSSDPLKTAFYRPKVDQFFFTIVYIIFMYMLATGSFKLIDQIPDGIMRWINQVKTFGVNDNADELVSNISQTVSIPLYTLGQPIVTKGVGLASQIPQGVGGMIGELKNMTPPPPRTPPAGGKGTGG